MKLRTVAVATLLFVLGVAVGLAAKKIESTMYRGQAKKDAAMALLELAKKQAGNGSWEKIGVGRVYYLAGMKAEGQALFDSVAKRRPEIGAYYLLKGDRAKAEEYFDRSFKIENDEVWATVAMASGYLDIVPQP